MEEKTEEAEIDLKFQVNIHDVIKTVLILVLVLIAYQLGQYNVIQFQRECTKVCLANPQFDPEEYRIDKSKLPSTPINTTNTGKIRIP